MIFENPLIGIFQVVFVIWFVLRTVRKYSSTLFHQKNLLPKIGTAFIFASIMLSVTFSPTNFIFFLPSILAFLCPIFLEIYFQKRLEILCYRGFYKMVDQIILEIYRGSSFRLALSKALAHLPPESRSAIADKFVKNSFSNQESSPFLPKIVQKYVNELVKIEQSSANQLGRLKHFRDHIYSQQDFRHKSGQALLQTRIQSLLITVLYVLVLLFSLFQHPWVQLQPFVFTSTGMLCAGLILLHTLTRKKKWKT